MFSNFQITGRLSIIIWLALTFVATSSVWARDDFSQKAILQKKLEQRQMSVAEPLFVSYTAHNRGNIQLAMANNGTFGTFGSSSPDPFTGEGILSCVYPKNSDIVFLWVGALWVGAISGRDTLVSTATEDWYQVSEFWPDPTLASDPNYLNGFIYRSLDINSPFYSEDAYSEEDIICSYTDTLTDINAVGIDPKDGRSHKPLGIKVQQRTMSWSYSYADDFILFDYQIQNIGTEDLKDVYLGIFVDGDVWHTSRNGPEGWNDDIVGFYRTHPALEYSDDCQFLDTVNIAFTADNDGDPDNGRWDYRSTLGTVGSRVVRTPSDSLEYSYNWWIINYSDPRLDFGPRMKGTDDDPFRSFGGRLGTPAGDKNKYYVLRHEEFDYDLMFSAIDQSGNGYLSPPPFAQQYAEGYDARYLLSFGPFEINPGQKLPISFCWVGGEDFHLNANDFEDYFDPYNPTEYYSKLNFNNLARNSSWASWVYDNPGVDTDNDGYRGKSRECRGKEIFYEGDGIPDFKGATPPPAPVFWVTPTLREFHIRFNGLHSETTEDQFSGLADFEGYRVYYALDERATSYSMIASFDLNDFNKYIVEVTADTSFQLVDGDTLNFRVDYQTDVKLLDPPFTLEQLKCLYAETGCTDESFKPLFYSRLSPFEFGDSLFYFEAQDYNSYKPGISTPISKIYPEQSYPTSLDPSQAEPDELTPDGYLKFFEYELTIKDILPTIPYYINVTAFDFGSPIANLASLETSVTIGTQIAYPLNSAQEVNERDLEAYVYPNPYRADGGYADASFENRLGNQAVARAHRIHFANLPQRCTIRIYSIDGDLIRTLEHDTEESDPTASHEEWDMITRNTQEAVSGLYYWVIESDTKTQIGKFVIIR